MDAHNNTRMIENRGHKPSELKSRAFSGGMPTIVPGSSHAVTILEKELKFLSSFLNCLK